MNPVVIKSDGFYYIDNDSENRDQVRITEHIFLHLNSTCSIEGATLKNLFDAVAEFPELIAFLTMYCHCDVEAFHAEAERPFEPPEDLASLRIYHNVIVDLREYDFEDVPSDKDEWHIRKIPLAKPVRTLRSNVEFDGRAKPGAETDYYGLSFTPMYQMRDLLLELDSTGCVYIEKPEAERGGGINHCIEAKTFFSLLDILRAIYWEISFYGSPSKRDVQGDIVEERLEEVTSGDYTGGIPIIFENTDGTVDE